MNVGIFLGHPAHFHYFKNLAHQLEADGHKVYYAVKEKDVLRQLMDEAGLSYAIVRDNRESASKWALMKSVIQIDWNIGRFVHINKIDILIGAIISYTTRFIYRKPIIIIGEDDARVVPLFSHLALPIAKYVISPNACDNGHWEYKAIKFPGYLKLTYLHPNYFSPDKTIVTRNGIDPNKPYFLIRFALLKAHHDKGISGITTEIAQRLIDILKPHGRIYITSERPLEPQFEQYRLQINPLDIHHVMAFASMYIGDSQSMANEAAMLGVPSLRFNDFVGEKKIGVMEELEHRYGLTFGISSREPDKLYAKVKELLAMLDRQAIFAQRRQKMLNEAIDVTAFLKWFIENYPQSAVTANSMIPSGKKMKPKNVGIFLGHPAHFHYFKNVARRLEADGHRVFFAVKEKDVLRQLMDDAGFPYTIVRENRVSASKWALIKSVVKIDWNIGRFVHKNKIDLLIGAIISYTTRLIYHKPIIVIGEDDARVVPLFSYQALPMAKYVITPQVCDNWHWEYKAVKYPANLELAYLHPNHFTPNPEIVRSYGIPVTPEAAKPYFILRFSSLNAHHDAEIKGINAEIAQRLIDILSPHGTIYITSERPLEPQFEQYRIKINPLDMHHVMAFASLYIGDSQTMAAEAGVLGVPFVRFNDFVGRIGYLKELEDVYELGYGIHATPLSADSPIRKADGSAQPSGVEKLYEVVEQLVSMDASERRALYRQRRDKLLAEKIDCAKFLTWFIEEYPASVDDVRKADAGFWNQFR